MQQWCYKHVICLEKARSKPFYRPISISHSMRDKRCDSLFCKNSTWYHFAKLYQNGQPRFWYAIIRSWTWLLTIKGEIHMKATALLLSWCRTVVSTLAWWLKPRLETWWWYIKIVVTHYGRIYFVPWSMSYEFVLSGHMYNYTNIPWFAMRLRAMR